MTQGGAIVKALAHGSQTTRELFDRLAAGGMTLKKPVYVTALLPRLVKKGQVERTKDGKIRLVANAPA